VVTGSIVAQPHPAARVDLSLADPHGGVGFDTSADDLWVQAEQPAGSGRWVDLFAGRRGAGDHTLALDLSALAPGSHAGRVRAVDALGQASVTRLGGAFVAGAPPIEPVATAPARDAAADVPPAAPAAEPPAAPPVGAVAAEAPSPPTAAPAAPVEPVPPGSRLDADAARLVAVNPGQARLASARVRFLVRYPRPRPVVLEGVFRAPGGAPLAGARLELVELGLVRAEGATDAAGVFRFRYTPTASGEVRVRWPGTARVRAISTGWEVEVVPYLAAGASRRIPSGRRLAVYGTFLPRPAAISAIAPTLRPRRTEARRGQPVLVYQVSPRRCPAFSGLRPVPARLLARVPERCFVGPLVQDRTALIRPNGRFATSARVRGPEGVGAYTVYVQGRVLATGGWPFAEARTRVFPVRLVGGR
ncbi:MAG TPA: hypothetical protein VKD47_05820, partial [Miltoncostaeaceae bacterium]|nr:hypothetical protein [Miltoncostaeaceae bacterium]